MTISQISLKDARVKIAVITIAVIAGLFYSYQRFIIKPKALKIQKLQSELENIKLQDEIARLYNENYLYQKNLAKEKDPSWLLTQITSFAQESGLDIKSIEPQTAKDMPPFTYISFKITANCTYTQLINFLRLAEASENYIGIDKLILDTNKNYKLEISKDEIQKPHLAGVEMTIGTIY